MAHLIIMPKYGQTMEEGTIAKWHKHMGQSVAVGEIIADVEADKATMEMESEVAGTILKIIALEGEPLKCGTPIAWIGQPGEPIPG